MKLEVGLTTQEIAKAQKKVEKFKKEFPNKLNQLLKNLADLGVRTAQETYGSSVSVEARPTEHGYTIYADGRSVCFMEFGTGVYADDSNLDHYQEVTFKVSPGSWSESEEGAHNWSKWEESGRPMDEWPYNRQARPGMFYAYQAILDAVAEEAKKVFQ